MCLTFTEDDHPHGLANLCIANTPDQTTGIGHIGAIEAEDHVACEHAGFQGGAFRHVCDQCAGHFLKANGLSHIVGYILNSDTEPSAAGFAEFTQLIDDAGHNVRRHGKPDADGATGRAQDRCVHTHDFAVQIEERPPRVATVDRSVGLNVVVIGARKSAVARRYDTGRDRETLTQWVAHGDHPVANACGVTIAEAHKRQRFIGVDLEQRDVCFWVCAHQRRCHFFAREELNDDFIGGFDDMVVGDHIPIFRNHEAGAKRRAAAGSVTVAVLEFAEEIFERRAFGHNWSFVRALGHDCRCGDVHHRRADAFGKVGKAFGPRMGCDGLCQDQNACQKREPHGARAKMHWHALIK